MRIALVSVLLLSGAALTQPACARQDAPAAAAQLDQGTPEQLYRSGRYDAAIAALASPADDAERRLLVRTLMEIGRYDDAERAALDGAALDAVPAGLANRAGEALYARGRRTEAEQLFARAASSDAPDALTARFNLGRAKWERGARADAFRDFDTFIDAYNDGRARTAEDLTAVAASLRYLGLRDPQLFHDAVRAFEEAARADATFAAPRLLEGTLFLDKYNSADASALFREVLSVNPRHPEALLGLARAKAFDGTNEALALVDSSLAVNPHAPAARAFRGQLLLGLEDHAGAVREAERALSVNPAALDALAVLGAAHFLRGDQRGHDQARRQALSLDPLHGTFDVTVAEMAVQQRRYADAVDIARRGLALDSANWSAHALIGLTELRLGNVDASRSSLERAFAGDPYNIWVKNTLDLLDTYSQYVTRPTARFELFLHSDEADLLELYMAGLAEDAYEQLTRRYGAPPATPVRVEVYPSHADFSVRSVGLAGLGALGIAFGNILALDSPAARSPGDFNWGSTLWHEIAHAVTLAASKHRVPRWLTEGISVMEERRARPGWGEDVALDFIVALKRGMILPVSELNSGFVRPRYPQQIAHAYYQSSLVAEWIEREFGDSALRDMLRAYGDGRTHDRVLAEVLRVQPRALDDRFATYLRERFTSQLAAVEVSGGTSPDEVQVGGPFVSALRTARAAVEAGDLATATREAERARAMFPEYAGANGPYLLLHEIARRNDDMRAAAAALHEHVARNERDYDAHIALATLLEEQGDARAAADMLERAMYIHPYDAAVHDRMARLYAETGQHDRSVRERRAILALAPANRADALYRLAVALVAAGDRAEARRQVLRALEIAPGFADAQDLLLQLQGAP